MKLFKWVIDYFVDCRRISKENTCPACGYIALVYHEDGTAGCALCGVEIFDRDEVTKLRDRGKLAQMSR
ncbi:hypothetical protein SAMN02745218_01163 [Desulfofundulus australicus DSM 11792]|uniref:Uncharacterized protein n=1 Tax=Desulfofundulus australicus DSM 11792 TaxID=1121425 RepID=A0A1M4XT16_9FIRM|nr:hypothetical protein [Desulfofundulus australicus]SHE96707.1 hypothetical protein SAMN02745218_01163 [Desulfofundulus australicus DSM 11792]